MAFIRKIDMDSLLDYEIEYYEKYFGDIAQVTKIVETCPKCGKKFFFSYQSDTTKLHIRETASCTSCDFGQRKIISSVN